MTFRFPAAFSLANLNLLFCLAVLMVALLVVLGGPAFAQDTTVDVGSIWDAWAPSLNELVGTIVAAIVGWLALIVKSKLNIDIEARHREALQAALLQAAGLVIGKVGDLTKAVKIDVKSAALAEGIEYVLSSAPDALSFFGLDMDDIAEKLKAKIGVVAATNTPLDPKPNV